MLLALMRGLFVAGALSSFGASLFIRLVLAQVAREGATPSVLVSRRLRAIVMLSLGVALLAGIAWLVLQTQAMAETQSLAETAAAIPSVLFDTRVGQVLCLQAAALAGAALLVTANARVSTLAAILAGLAVLLEAGHSHAFAMARGVSPLLLSQSVHLLAAGAWLGGLLPLLVVVANAPLDMAKRSLRRFSPLAAIAVGLIAGTAILQAVALSGGLNGLFGTAYGAVLLIKAALFGVLVALAANNRLRLTPRLASGEDEGTRRSLAVSIGIETAIGLLVVLASATLSGLEPGMHITSG